MEKAGLVTCPSCSSLFAPHQHMIFEISRDDIEQRLAAAGMQLVGFYRSVDTSVPKNGVKASVKVVLIKVFSAVGQRLFSKPGVTAFIARKVVQC